MTKQECLEFVLKGLLKKKKTRASLFCNIYIFLGVTLAITRDGSSGGCARLAIINKDGVERIDVLGNDLPKVFDL
jgi:uncharacterized membrane protein